MNRSWKKFVSVRSLMVLSLLFVLGGAGGGGGGCATYVNIPGQEEDVASNSPNTRNVTKVYIAALQAAAQDQSDQAYRFVLPSGTKAWIYQQVQAGLDKARQKASRADQAPESDAASLTVQGVRIRTTQADVDILRRGFRSSLDRPVDARLQTVYLRWVPLDGWQADRVRTWQVDPNQPLLNAPPGSPAGAAPSDPASAK